MFKAIQRGNEKEVEKLIRLKNVDVNARHDLGWSPLHLAAVNGRQEVDPGGVWVGLIIFIFGRLSVC